MRVSKAQAAENRQQILTAAARLFRQRGVSATGVDAIAEDAGLTHGAVYSQFGSKEVIAAEAIRLALERGSHLWQRIAKRKGSKRAFPAIVAQYLSRAHRDDAGRGCVIAALGGEVARQPETVRDALTAELEHAVEFLAELMPPDEPPRRGPGERGRSIRNSALKLKSSRRYDDALMAFASMAGALILARAVSDQAMSDRILKTTAKRIIDGPRRARSTN